MMSLAAETPPTMSEPDRLAHPSSAPPEAEDDSIDALAARILARAKGVVGPAPSDIGGAVGRAFGRLVALPIGLSVGAGLGLVLGLVALLIGGTWKTKLVRFLAAPLAGLALGVFIGWR